MKGLFKKALSLTLVLSIVSTSLFAMESVDPVKQANDKVVATKAAKAQAQEQAIQIATDAAEVVIQKAAEAAKATEEANKAAAKAAAEAAEAKRQADIETAKVKASKTAADYNAAKAAADKAQARHKNLDVIAQITAKSAKEATAELKKAEAAAQKATTELEVLNGTYVGWMQSISNKANSAYSNLPAMPESVTNFTQNHGKTVGIAAVALAGIYGVYRLGKWYTAKPAPKAAVTAKAVVKPAAKVEAPGFGTKVLSWFPFVGRNANARIQQFAAAEAKAQAAVEAKAKAAKLAQEKADEAFARALEATWNGNNANDTKAAKEAEALVAAAEAKAKAAKLAQEKADEAFARRLANQR